MRFSPYFLLPLVLMGMVVLFIPLGIESAGDSALQTLFSEGRFCHLFAINYSFNDDSRGLRGLFSPVLMILSGIAALQGVFASFFPGFQHKILLKALENSSFLGSRGPPFSIPA